MWFWVAIYSRMRLWSISCVTEVSDMARLRTFVYVHYKFEEMGTTMKYVSEISQLISKIILE